MAYSFDNLSLFHGNLWLKKSDSDALGQYLIEYL